MSSAEEERNADTSAVEKLHRRKNKPHRKDKQTDSTAESMVVIDATGNSGGVVTSSGQLEDWGDLGNQDEWVVIN